MYALTDKTNNLTDSLLVPTNQQIFTQLSQATDTILSRQTNNLTYISTDKLHISPNIEFHVLGSFSLPGSLFMVLLNRLSESGTTHSVTATHREIPSTEIVNVVVKK